MTLVKGADYFDFEDAQALTEAFVNYDNANLVWESTFSGNIEVLNINVEELEDIVPPFFYYLKCAHLLYLTSVFSFNEFKNFINKWFQKEHGIVDIEAELYKSIDRNKKLDSTEKRKIRNYVSTYHNKSEKYFSDLASKETDKKYDKAEKYIKKLFRKSTNYFKYEFSNDKNHKEKVKVQISDISKPNIVNVKILLLLRELGYYGTPNGDSEDKYAAMMHVLTGRLQYFHGYQVDNAKKFTTDMMTILLEESSGDKELIDIINSFETGYKSNKLQGSLEKSKQYTTKGGDYDFLLGKKDGDNVYYRGEGGLITIAPPGSGKTQCHVLPTLKSFKGGAIVLDIKGECALHTARLRRDNGHPIYVFSPTYTDKSDSYNPLDFVSDDPELVWDDARLLAEILVVPRSQSDPTWEVQGRQLLTLIIAYTAFQPADNRNMGMVLDLISEMGLEDALELMAEQGSLYPSSMRRTAHKYLQVKQTAEKQFQGILSGASQHLTVWEGSSVEKITKRSDWTPEEFRSTNPPTLYLIVAPHEIEAYAPLLRVIIAQHVRQLLKEEPSRDAPRVLFMLDELPRLGPMEPIRQALETGRSYGIQLWMFAQYVGQMRAAYGKEIADGMIAACGARCYMNVGSDLANELSDIIGKSDATSVSASRPFVKPQELMQPEWRDDILVLGTGENPLRLKKVFFHQQSEAPKGPPEVERQYSEQDVAEVEIESRSRL